MFLSLSPRVALCLYVVLAATCIDDAAHCFFVEMTIRFGSVSPRVSVFLCYVLAPTRINTDAH